MVAAKLTRRAADTHAAATGQRIAVAGSIGPTGELFEPLGALDHRSAVQGF